MYVFTPNTLIESAKINANFDDANNRLAVFETAYVESTLGAGFNTTASTAFQNTGLSVTLPDIGTWLVVCELRWSGPATANAYGVFRLYNSTTSAEITNSKRLSHFATDVIGYQVTVPLIMPVATTTANNVIRVELSPNPAGIHTLASDTNGVSRMFAMRLK